MRTEPRWLRRALTKEGKLRWHSTVFINKTWQAGRFQLNFEWKRNDGFTGRMGGGWSGKLGVMWSPSEVIVQLIFCSIRFTWKAEKEEKQHG